MVSRNAVVGVAGALVILFAVAGLWEIAARAGPYDTTIRPADVPVTAEGSYLARGPQGTTGPGGTCIPDSPGGQCAPARLDIELRLGGLPPMAPAAHYVAFLVAPAMSPLVLGPLELENGRHTLDVDQERDARDYRTLVVTLERGADVSSPGTLRVFVADVAGRGQDDPYDLRGDATARPLDGIGSVRTTEIGGVSISTTAIGDLTLSSAIPGWTLHAWFQPHDAASTPTYLGAWHVPDENAKTAVLDARVERVRLEDQAMFVTTLVPADAVVDAGGGVEGLPVFAAPLAD